MISYQANHQANLVFAEAVAVVERPTAASASAAASKCSTSGEANFRLDRNPNWMQIDRNRK